MRPVSPIRNLALLVKRIKMLFDSINSICSITNSKYKGLLKPLAFTNVSNYYFRHCFEKWEIEHADEQREVSNRDAEWLSRQS